MDGAAEEKRQHQARRPQRGAGAPAGECDDPRIIEQLEGTALAATGATDVRILVDGVPIRDVLSLR